MGFFKNKILGITQKETGLVKRETGIADVFQRIVIHPDVEGLLWIGDGPRKNYYPDDSSNRYSVDGVTFTVTVSGMGEPSLIYTSLPVDFNQGNVGKLPYYPSYEELTPGQRGKYLEFLGNPYSEEYEVGYVFLLYYGLERHLLMGEYERAFEVILKMRDVHSNVSFQTYSSNAIILTCLKNQRADLALRFMQSIDKEYEYEIPDNLYLFCKYSLSIPLTAKDIVRLAKSFEFTKTNYIRNYPDLFLEALQKNMQSDFGTTDIQCNDFIKTSEYRKLPTKNETIFANVSIMDNTIDVPLLIHAFNFKRAMNDLLNKTHEDVKKTLGELRKAEKEPAKKSDIEKEKNKEVLAFDEATEKELLANYNDTLDGSLDEHFASIALQDFYYKYRDVDSEYLMKCIDYCRDDISKLGLINKSYIQGETTRIKELSFYYSREEIEERISKIGFFDGTIPAFRRLVIIFEKEKEYEQAIKVCNQAIEYYSKVGLGTKEEFEERKEKLLKKLEAISMQ